MRPSEYVLDPKLTSKIVVVIDDVKEDDWCFRLYEHNRSAMPFVDEFSGRHRFQVIQVIRERAGNVWIGEQSFDLGPANMFKDQYGRPDDGFNIVGSFVNDEGKYEIVHTVGELQYEAFKARGTTGLDPERMILDGEDLISRYLDEEKIRRDTARGVA